MSAPLILPPACCCCSPVSMVVEVITICLPVVIFVAVLPAVIPWRVARGWRLAVPRERRRPQFQLLEIICVWFLFSPPIALMAGRGASIARALRMPSGVVPALGVALAWYMVIGAYAGWARARYETGGRLPSPWRSCECMVIGSLVPPALAALALGVTVLGVMAFDEGVIFVGWGALICWALARLASKTDDARRARRARRSEPHYEWEKLGASIPRRSPRRSL